jgi:hypothetical protein
MARAIVDLLNQFVQAEGFLDEILGAVISWRQPPCPPRHSRVMTSTMVVGLV